MVYLKWLAQRLIFLKRVLIEFQKRILYQEVSQFLLHRYNAHACPYESMLFYSLWGRMLFALRESIALITQGRVFKKSIQLDGFEKHNGIYHKGANSYLYPISPMVNRTEVAIEEGYYQKIAKALFLAYEYEQSNKESSQEWQRIADAFKELFFDENLAIKKEALANFRGDPAIYSKIFNDQYSYISTNKSYAKNYLEAVDLVLEYHRYAAKINPALLASVSESLAGGYLSVNYRGKRLSDQLLLHTVVVNDLIEHLPLSRKREITLDIGAGFGGIARLLNYYREESTQILIDLPETLMLTAYYIKYNFPNKKIALLDDIIDDLENFNEAILAYDFVIVPPFILEYIENQSVDLVINVASLAFMSKVYLEYYLEHIDRVLREGGYFYSLNSSQDTVWGTGMDNWEFKSNYLTLSHQYNNRFSYPQWLGKKLKK